MIEDNKTVPFEIAKKAKEVGYPQELFEGYISPFDAWHEHGLDWGLSSHSEDYDIENLVKKIHPMALQEWLRTQGVITYAVPFDISSAGGWAYNIQQWEDGRLLYEKEQVADDIDHSFDEALVMGLEKGLELLKRNKKE